MKAKLSSVTRFSWFLLLLTILFSPMPLSAEEAWRQVGNGSPTTCTEHALAEAILLGGKIKFACGGAFTFFLTNQLNISRPTILDGGGVITLDGQKRNGILRTGRNSSLTVRGLRFVNGNTGGQGGALDIGYWSELVVEDSIFINNIARKNSRACDGGGAIFIGGGGKITVRNSQFYGNRSENGGAINILRSATTIINSTFDNNHARHSDQINQHGDCGGGGAVYIDSTRRPEDGGPDAIILRGNRYTNNSTNNHGGALFIGVKAGEKVEVSWSYFARNAVHYVASMSSSGTGGAIWYARTEGGATGHYLTISQSAFIENHADTQGGGVWTSAPATVVNSTFYGNTAINPASLSADDWRKGNGGGIAVAHQSLVILNNVTIAHNRAGFNGGGVVGENIVAQNSLVANNIGDWYRGLQQNCTHALQTWGPNLQFLRGYASSPSELARRSNCGLPVGDPLLGALTTQGSLPLLPNSPAREVGNGASCAPIDQLGTARPQGGGCDLGAWEG